MNREVHVRFWEGLAVRFRWATQLSRRSVHRFSTFSPEAGLDDLPLRESNDGCHGRDLDGTAGGEGEDPLIESGAGFSFHILRLIPSQRVVIDS